MNSHQLKLYNDNSKPKKYPFHAVLSIPLSDELSFPRLYNRCEEEFGPEGNRWVWDLTVDGHDVFFFKSQQDLMWFVLKSNISHE